MKNNRIRKKTMTNKIKKKTKKKKTKKKKTINKNKNKTERRKRKKNHLESKDGISLTNKLNNNKHNKHNNTNKTLLLSLKNHPFLNSNPKSGTPPKIKLTLHKTPTPLNSNTTIHNT